MRADVEQAIKKFEIKTFGNKGNIENAEKNLWDTEQVLYVSPTNAIVYTINTRKKEKLPGVFILTDRRVLFFFKAGFSEASIIFNLSEVNSINCSGNGLSGGHIEIHTVTKTLDILVTYKKEIMREIQNTINNAISKCQGQVQSNTSVLEAPDEIRKYKQLLDDGIITQEEFEAKKKQLLGL